MAEAQATDREERDDDRVEELEEDIQFVDEKVNSRIDQTVMPRLDALESQSDDARDERAELFQLVESLQETVAELDQRLQDMAGLAEGQASNPDKRLSDLRQAMVRRAKARDDNDADEYAKVALWWKEVQNLFADLGHGEISKPDCYKAISDLEDYPGFSTGKKTNDNGNRVKAIRLDLAELRAHAAGRNPTTPEAGRTADEPTEPDPVSKK